MLNIRISFVLRQQHRNSHASGMRLVSSLVFFASPLVVVSSLQSQACKWIPNSSLPHFDTQIASSDCLLDPYLVIQEKTSIPHNQAWSYCRYCVFMNESDDIHHFFSPESVELSWSQWSEFFSQKNDLLNTKGEPKMRAVSAGSLLISTPIFIMPIICYHVGHLLVDFMEQVYSTMLEVYGEVRTDALLVIDVSNREERRMLSEILNKFVNSEKNESFDQMLRWLSNRPIMAFEMFVRALSQLSSNAIIFSDIHFGGDISSTLMHIATPHQPCQFQLHDPSLIPFSRSYQHFHKFISQSIEATLSVSPPSSLSSSSSVISYSEQPLIDVLFVFRNSSRLIVNMQAMVDLVSSKNLTWLSVDFAILPFKLQLQYLRKTRLLVATAGTAMHNMVFMNRSTSAIVLMMPEWCHCSWQYANQGILLGIDVSTYCQEGDMADQVSLSHWTAHFWLQCSVTFKSSDVTVDLHRFSSDLDRLFGLSPPAHERERATQLKVTTTSLGHWCYIGREPSPLIPSRTHHLPVFRITLLTSQFINGLWKVELAGELSNPLRPQHMWRSFPHLSVCFILHDMKLTDVTHSCYPMDTLNYHSKYMINSPYPIFSAHSWGQVSPHGGKIKGSDSYLTIDMGASDLISRASPEVALTIGTDCPGRNTTLICRVEGLELSLCVGVISLESSFEISLQPIVTELCSLHNLSCPLLSSLLSHCVHKRIMETHMSLPHPQYLPTPSAPFVFLHLEKTAGTTIRK
jgi:hypothetical protein